jgi:hypothetical protein
MVFAFSGTALAWSPPSGGDAETEVSLSEITIDPVSDTYYTSDTVTASGTVTITSTAEASGFFGMAYAESYAYYSVESPSGDTVASGSQSAADSWGFDDADASQVYSWTSTPFELTEDGDYIITQGGTAYAAWSTWFDGDSSSDADSVLLALPVIVPDSSPSYSVPDWDAGPSQFSLWVGGMHSYNWIDGNALPAIDLEAKAYWNGTCYDLKIVIPEGTEVHGGYCLKFAVKDGSPVFVPITHGAMAFSNPVTVYEKQDGAWVEILQFSLAP